MKNEESWKLRKGSWKQDQELLPFHKTYTVSLLNNFISHLKTIIYEYINNQRKSGGKGS